MPTLPLELKRPSLDGQHFEIVIIGGGINGVAIARECAQAGKRVLLVEQNDFSSGTTSRATRIIHGGLRYLEHGEISLVRESLRERERLVRERGHLVRPLNFLLALPPDGQRSALEVRFGLWLYRRFAGRPSVHPAKNDKKAVERLLDSEQSWSVFAYEDAQCEYPERLVAEWLRESAHAGAVICNHCEALEVEVANDKVKGLRLRDRLTKTEFRVDCRYVINATGPWADSICQRSNICLDEPMIGGVRGSHILFPTFPGAPKAAVYTEAVDGRPIFVIPWAGHVLVGTTEIKDTADPGKARPSPDEIDYLVRSFQRLFPSIGYDFSDIRAAFAGVRPLPFVSNRSPDSITRSHLILDHSLDRADGLASIIGGKLTTAASLAREAARAVGIQVPEPKGYAVELPNPQNVPDSGSIGKNSGLNRHSVKNIFRWFGPATEAIVTLAGQEKKLRDPIFENTEHVVAEAVYAVQNEFAVSLADILLRRVPVTLSNEWTPECLSTATQRIGKALGWNEHRQAEEMESFSEEYSRFLTKPATVIKGDVSPPKDL